jgi:lipoprotein-anchoring transpeptidase ErfK/SrfK
MRSTLTIAAGLACAFLAQAAPAAAYEIDPFTREPILPAHGFVPQAAAIPRAIVRFDARYPAGTVVVSTPERRLYYVLGNGKPSATASASGGRASPGPGRRASRGKPNGRAGRRPPRCSSAGRTSRGT